MESLPSCFLLAVIVLHKALPQVMPDGGGALIGLG